MNNKTAHKSLTSLEKLLLSITICSYICIAILATLLIRQRNLVEQQITEVMQQITEVLKIENIKSELSTKYANETLNWADIKDLPVDDSLRTFVCQLGPEWAFGYAVYVDKKPHNETRTAASRDPYYAFAYAFSIDKKPLDETRTACCKDPFWAYYYAKEVDMKPLDETREAAYKDPMLKLFYIDRFGE